MSKKHTHGPVPKHNQPKHAIEPRKWEPDENDDHVAQAEVVETESRPAEDVADEKGRIAPPTRTFDSR
jgi:hypothetical protein